MSYYYYLYIGNTDNIMIYNNNAIYTTTLILKPRIYNCKNAWNVPFWKSLENIFNLKKENL
jgi:hypothetical protein